MLLVVVVTCHSLVRAMGEVFVLLYVFFVRSTTSRQPASKFGGWRCAVVPIVPWGAERGS